MDFHARDLLSPTSGNGINDGGWDQRARKKEQITLCPYMTVNTIAETSSKSLSQYLG